MKVCNDHAADGDDVDSDSGDDMADYFEVFEEVTIIDTMLMVMVR